MPENILNNNYFIIDNQLNIVSKIKEFRRPFFLFFVFIVLSLILLAAGLYYYTTQQKKIKFHIYSSLEYISKVKCDQIENWRRERIKDAKDIQANQSLINDVNLFLGNNDNLKIKTRILNWLVYLSKNADYTNVYLLDKYLNIKMQTNPEMYLDNETYQLFKKMIIDRNACLTDLYQSRTNHKVHMDLIVPLLNPDSNNGNIIGLIIIIIDPKKEFYPLILTWPTDSYSGETYLVRTENDNILFLNKLRFMSNSPLIYKIPINADNTPEVQAVHGYEGIYEGKDYRNIIVVSDIRHITGTKWWMISKEDLDEILAPLNQSSLIIFSFVFIFLLISGSTVLYRWKSQQSKYYKDHYRHEVEKQRQQYLLHLIMESLPVGIWIYDNNANITDRNIKALEIWGGEIYSWVDEYNQRPAWYYETGKKIETGDWASTKALKTGKSTINEIIEIECLDGTHKIIFNSAVPVYENGNKIIGAVVVNQDITELKRAEESLKDSLKEKEILLKELYHRTKNNMQVISSLLGLKAASIEDERLTKILDEMNVRIQTISLVHQKLYQSQNLSRIDLKDYITDLINLIEKSYQDEPGRISITTDLESINVLIDTAIPCGLIINELVSNAFKYAFPGKRKGCIKINLKHVVGDIIELNISDDGVGVPEGFNMMETNTLGYKLFKNIAENQLMGTIKIDNQKGLSFTVHFREIYKERV